MVNSGSVELIAAALPGVVERGELVAYFQPQIDVKTGRVVAAEALCRWNNPEIGAVAPSDFIPVAEETGVIREIGLFMLSQACEFVRIVEDETVSVAVNISAVELQEQDFSARAVETMEAFEIDATRLTFELTESRPIGEGLGAVEHLTRLRELGAEISIDDFGAGFSSLQQLDSLPFTELKIDQSLIREDTEETWSRLSMLVATMRQRGMRIVAEGVETQEQFDQVRETGCDRAQGYFLGMPMPLAEFVEFLEAQAA